jgi:hypothetical protein
MRFAIALLATGVSLAVLSGCGEEETVVAEPPVAEEPSPQPDATPQQPSAAEQAAERLREAAELATEAAREEAARLAERGRQALDEAGPVLDRAGEVAGQIRDSLGEIADQAVRDFEAGVAVLEQRIAESTGTGRPVTADEDALLAPADRLRADTRAAAQAGPAGVGPAYVGVWAADAASCARIDQEAVEMFAVITPTTIRRYESVCNFEPVDMAGDDATLQASCIAEGDVEERAITLSMPSPDRLEIGLEGAAGTADLVRCRLP